MSLLEIKLERPKSYHWITIDGEPQSWKRPGRYRHNASAEYQEHIANMVRAAVPGIQPRGGLWGVRFAFYHGPSGYRRDWDNLAKNCCDAIQKVVFHNDALVREAYVIVIRDPRPRTEMLLYEITPEYLNVRLKCKSVAAVAASTSISLIANRGSCTRALPSTSPRRRNANPSSLFHAASTKNSCRAATVARARRWACATTASSRAADTT